VLAAVRGGFLRLGFHAFNDESDVSAALDALGRP
jgi:selenocysteine lyase/cysteine desulfurase